MISDLYTNSIFSSVIPFDFGELIQVVPLQYLIYFLAGTNNKQFWNIHEKKEHFASFRLLKLFTKSFVNPIVDITLTFSNSSFNSLVYYQNLSF